MKALRIFIVAVLVLGLTSVLMAESGGAAATEEIVGGTIPFNAQWTFTDVSQLTKLAAASEAEYDAVTDGGLIAIADIQVCSNLDANDSLSVAAKVGSWTVPTTYHTYPTNGHKNSVDATSDFKILANNFAGGNLTHSGTFNAYTLLTDSDQEIINSTATGATGVGVEGESFDIDCQVLLDWLTDPPGAYSITMTLTLSQEAGLE